MGGNHRSGRYYYYYYKGVGLQNGLSVEIEDPRPTGSGFVATNNGVQRGVEPPVPFDATRPHCRAPRGVGRSEALGVRQRAASDLVALI